MANRDQSSLVYPQVQQAGMARRALSRGLSLLFRGAGSLRNAAYDHAWKTAHRLPGKVISVGNIAVGGTGKTPVVMALIAHLLQRGHRPAVLTRGYGSGLGRGDWILLLAGRLEGGNCRPLTLPDEARLQSVSYPEVPVIAGAGRFRAASAFLSGLSAHERPTHWILDDGFQHRAIERDFDLVLIDRRDPFGNHCVLPYGMLRETVASLGRADHILLTGSGDLAPDLSGELMRCAPGVPVSVADQVSCPLARDSKDAIDFSPAQHTPVLVVAGIARPEHFFRDLENDGVRISARLTPGDHGTLRADELETLAKSARAVVATAKDYWRNPDVFRALKIPVFVKNVEIHLPGSLLTALP
jgi:tetraacyldisaccharide 4'-kinase